MVRKGSEQGFTLVELSIVLVIIGLIVGGVLAGQDLIKGAQSRATVQQIQQYDAAANTFRVKYDGLPGDFDRAVAFNIGSTPTNGDNDGMIEGVPGGTDDASRNASFDAENAHFWVHLSATNLIPGSYNAQNVGAIATGVGVVNEDFPSTKLQKGGIGVFVQGALNQYALGLSDGGIFGSGFTPAEAFGIDSKIDDGVPRTGIVRPVGAALQIDAGAALIDSESNTTDPTLSGCSLTTGTAPNTVTDYHVSNEANECPLIIRMSS